MREYSFAITPQGPFALQEVARFFQDWEAGPSNSATHDGHVHLAFLAEHTWQPIGVCLRQDGATLHCAVVSDVAPATARVHIERILSLHTDAREYPLVGERDPVIGGLMEQHPGLRPVCFYSVYEAGVWALLSQRISMNQAAAIKQRLCDEHGPTVTVCGATLHCFPGPATLQTLEAIPGVPERKLAYMHGFAAAVLRGGVDAESLGTLPSDAALAQLQAIPGVGPFSAQLMLLRAVGMTDFLTLVEPRLPQAVQLAYSLDHEPDTEALRAISDAWRPWRLWVTVLLRVSLEAMRRNARSIRRS